MEALLKNSTPSHSRDLEDAVDSIQTARRLHEQLIERNLSTLEKAKCGRDVANLLCNVEAGRNLALHLRHSLIRLRAVSVQYVARCRTYFGGGVSSIQPSPRSRSISWSKAAPSIFPRKRVTRA